MPGESGLDMNEVYLAPGAATKVSQAFKDAVDKLEGLRNDVLAFNVDLGMGACAEGTSWNKAVGEMVAGDSDSALAVVDAHIKTVKTWAEWAAVAQKEYDSTEHHNAESFTKLDNDPKARVYPPPVS